MRNPGIIRYRYHRHFLREKSYLGRVCNRINKLVPCSDDGEIMNIIHEMYCHNPKPFNFEVYWYRDLYMRCNFDNERAWDVFLHTGLAEAVVSDDIWEHPGIVIRLKSEY